MTGGSRPPRPASNGRSIEVALTCTPGFESLVARAAGRQFENFDLISLSSGWVRAETTTTGHRLAAFPCATNVFQVLAARPRASLLADIGALDRALRRRPSDLLPTSGTFRLRVHDDGTFVPASDAVRRLEQQLARWSGLTWSARGGQVEFWLIRRREEDSVLTAKLTPGGAKVPRGMLRPEVAACLARVAPLEGSEMVLDPFAGSGAIGAACLGAGAREVWLNDADPTRRYELDGPVRVTHQDFRELAGDVSALVTDPPWGRYRQLEPAAARDLYEGIGQLATSVVRPGGPVVVLCGADEDAIVALTSHPSLTLVERFGVLINGRKACVLHLCR